MNTLSKEYREMRAAEIKAELFAQGMREAERASKAQNRKRLVDAGQFGIQHEGLPTATMPTVVKRTPPGCSLCGNQSEGMSEIAVSTIGDIRQELAESKRRESQLQEELGRCYPLISHWAKQAHQLTAQLKRISLLENAKTEEIQSVYRLVGEMVGDNSPEISYFAERVKYQIERKFPEVIDWRFKQALTAKEPKA